MFIAPLFTIANRQKKPKCSSIDEWMNKMWYICIYNGILLIHKKNEILPFVSAWLDLQGIMLSEISQRKANTIHFHLYVPSKKKKQTNE